MRPGPWKPPPVCNKRYTLGPQETCSSIIDKFFPKDPVPFFALNPGIDCGLLADPAIVSSVGALGTDVRSLTSSVPPCDLELRTAGLCLEN